MISIGCVITPFLGRIRKKDYLFPAGLFEGYGKPKNINEYLCRLVNDLNPLLNQGFTVNDQLVEVLNVNFIFDSPARSMILNTKQAPGYNCCHKCMIRGEYDQTLRTINYLGVDFPARTQEQFIQKDYYDPNNKTNTYHLTNEKVEIENILNIDIPRNSPIDYMHCSCLGTMKKLLEIWIKSSKEFVSSVDAMLVPLKKNWPKEFQRQVRSLKYIDHYKATEFRTWLLYIGPAILKDLMPIEQYIHFCYLHHGFRLLFSFDENFGSKIDLAQQSINKFLTDWPMFYPTASLSYTTHANSHLPEDCRNNWCTPDGFSAFIFESWLRRVKDNYHGGARALEQVCINVSFLFFRF